MEFFVTGRLFPRHPSSVPGNSINHFRFIPARWFTTYGCVREMITTWRTAHSHLSV